MELSRAVSGGLLATVCFLMATLMLPAVRQTLSSCQPAIFSLAIHVEERLPSKQVGLRICTMVLSFEIIQIAKNWAKAEEQKPE